MNPVLIAGIGNLFLGDDGFGVAVLQRLAGTPLPPDVSAADYGIGGVHLAYDLLDGDVRTLVLVDAMPAGEPPGTLCLLEIDDAAPPDPAPVEAHSMTPDAVLGTLHALGGRVERVLVVGCQPQSVAPRMGLSEPVAAAVEAAAELAVRTAAAAAGALIVEAR